MERQIILLILIVESVEDIRKREIPQVLWIAVGIAGCINFKAANLAGIGLALPFFIAAMLTKGKGMGGGDIKLIAALGFAIGPAKTFVCIVLCLVSVLLFTFTVRVIKGNKLETVPLVPFLTAGYIVTIALEVL
jgi:leader peptidase (prepilin peptidase)/N-methyltransferase